MTFLTIARILCESFNLNCKLKYDGDATYVQLEKTDDLSDFSYNEAAFILNENSLITCIGRGAGTLRCFIKDNPDSALLVFLNGSVDIHNSDCSLETARQLSYEDKVSAEAEWFHDHAIELAAGL